MRKLQSFPAALPFTPPAALTAVNVSLAFKDRRVPYYVLPGCDFMLDAGDRCEKSVLRVFAPAVGCCPIGFECITPQEETRLGLSEALYLGADEIGLKVGTQGSNAQGLVSTAANGTVLLGALRPKLLTEPLFLSPFTVCSRLQVARCHHVTPPYTMSPGCSKDRQATLGESCKWQPLLGCVHSQLLLS